CTRRWKENKKRYRLSELLRCTREQIRGDSRMSTKEPITLSRECKVVEIPSGISNKLPPGTIVRIMQDLGTSYTVYSDYGLMYRIDAKDADALGLTNVTAPEAPVAQQGTFREEMVWDQLK